MRSGENASVAGAREGHAGAQLPLAMVSPGDVVRVLRVRGNEALRQHLAEMGFTEDAEVRVVSCVKGDVVVSLRGSTLAIGRDTAMKVVTY